jgi:hypothetical protein
MEMLVAIQSLSAGDFGSYPCCYIMGEMLRMMLIVDKDTGSYRCC